MLKCILNFACLISTLKMELFYSGPLKTAGALLVDKTFFISVIDIHHNRSLSTQNIWGYFSKPEDSSKLYYHSFCGFGLVLP